MSIQEIFRKKIHAFSGYGADREHLVGSGKTEQFFPSGDLFFRGKIDFCYHADYVHEKGGGKAYTQTALFLCGVENEDHYLRICRTADQGAEISALLKILSWRIDHTVDDFHGLVFLYSIFLPLRYWQRVVFPLATFPATMIFFMSG